MSFLYKDRDFYIKIPGSSSYYVQKLIANKITLVSSAWYPALRQIAEASLTIIKHSRNKNNNSTKISQCIDVIETRTLIIHSL